MTNEVGVMGGLGFVILILANLAINLVERDDKKLCEAKGGRYVRAWPALSVCVRKSSLIDLRNSTPDGEG
jgi:hypothetical protein